MAAISPKHETHLRVRYAETDQMSVVYYANYYVWMELGRVELVRSLGMNYRDLEEKEGLLLAVIESSCRYLRPARYDQEITVETTVGEVTPRVVEFTYEIRCTESGELLAKGMTKHMWLNRQWRPAKLPENYLELLTTPRKTDTASSAPRKGQRVPFIASGHASESFALLASGVTA